MNRRFDVECIGHDIRSTQFARGGCCDTLTANDFKDPGIVAYCTEPIIPAGGSTRHDGTGDQHDGDGKQSKHPDLDRLQVSTGYMP